MGKERGVGDRKAETKGLPVHERYPSAVISSNVLIYQ